MIWRAAALIALLLAPWVVAAIYSAAARGDRGEFPCGELGRIARNEQIIIVGGYVAVFAYLLLTVG